jgi:hypothetical protein
LNWSATLYTSKIQLKVAIITTAQNESSSLESLLCEISCSLSGNSNTYYKDNYLLSVRLVVGDKAY